MHSRRPHLTTSHKRRRLALWTLTVLQWIAAVLFAGKQITLRQLAQRWPRISLERLTRTVIKLIIVRAGELARRRPPKRLRFWNRGRDLRRDHIVRSLLGSSLRRALKHKDLATRIARLIGVLRNLDAYAQRLALRFKRGLTRLWAIPPAPTRGTRLPGPPAPSPAFANTS
jgi:hypothetical protein